MSEIQPYGSIEERLAQLDEDFGSYAVEEVSPETENSEPLPTYTDDVPLNDSVRLYLREISEFPLLSREEEHELALGVVDGDEQARAKMIRHNLRLVVSIAKRYKYRGGLPFLDLIQEGNTGLMRAIDKFDPDKGFKLSTYATWWIRQSIGRAVMDQGDTIRMPVHVHESINKMKSATKRLEQRLGRAPTDEEIAEEAAFTYEKVMDLQQAMGKKALFSLDVTLQESDRDTTFGALIEDKNAESPEEVAVKAALRGYIDSVLDTLPERERQVIMLRFGLDTGVKMTLEEVGKRFGITRERARQIENIALQRLNRDKDMRKLRDYLD